MRPVRIIAAVMFAAAVAVTGCSAHSTIAERAELTIIVEGGASAGYGVSGVEFGD